MSVLDEVQARADAATEGPWRWSVIPDQPRQKLIGPDEGVLRTSVLCYPDKHDAEFIAHAREDVPKLVAALRAVIDLHAVVCEVFGDKNCDNTVCPTRICGSCAETWPCPTMQSISGVIDG